MSKTVKQQILISGVGGQGVLFVTGLLAQAAIDKGLPVNPRHGPARGNGGVAF
jgi:indolepyruvate ferredoxin oxidoreductase beta subunit